MIRTESAAELIAILNQVDEHEDIEAKAVSGADLGKSVLETICALSNEPSLDGGTILLGVAKDESSLFPLYSAQGVGDPDKLSCDLQSKCSSQFNTPIRVDIKPELVDGNVVLRIDVPELPKTNKPAFFSATGLPKGAWRRIGPSDVRCTEEDLRSFWVGQTHEPYDGRLAKDSDMGDIDDAAVRAYRAARAEFSPNDEHMKWPDEDLLYSLGAIRKVDERWRPTIAGLLMFGRSMAIRRCFPTVRVDYIRVDGNQWVPDAAATYKSLDMRDAIIRLIPRVISTILDDLPKTFSVGDSVSGQRTETSVIPFRAIREAVVNALMHRSYESNSPVQIIRYTNRLEIKNPGFSLKSQDRFEEPGSEIRNTTIAALLHETRFAETKGSGIRIMQKTMQEHGLTSPAFRSDRERSEFSVSFLFHHFLNESDWRWLQSFSEFELDEAKMKALVFARESGAIDNFAYRSLNGVDTLTASKALRELRKAGLLTAKGGGASAYYVPGDEMITRAIQYAERETIHDKRAIMDGTIHDKGLRIEQLPPPLRTRARTAYMRKRLDAAWARKLIFDLCKWRPLSATEIADLVGKTRDYVSQRFIGPMISDGSLRYTIEQMPKHPDQKYAAGELLKD